MRLTKNETMRRDADWAEAGDIVAYRQEASDDAAAKVIAADVESGDGRSQWFWLRLATGDLVLATYPQGDTYFETEADRTI